MDEESGLVFGWLLDGQGGGAPVGWTEVDGWTPDRGTLWLHLDLNGEQCRRWLVEDSSLDPIVLDALMAEETRPRTVHAGSGLIVILRGVNLNPGSDPEDMVSLRVWIEDRRVITIRKRAVMAVRDINDRIEAGLGPRSSSEFLVELAARLIERMAPIIEELDDQADDLEDQLVEGGSREIRHGLRDLRRTAIALRRYLSPQRDSMVRLQSEDTPWLEPRQRSRIREVTDRLIHYVEDLDEVRDRAAVVQDELMNRLSEQMNRNMYLLSLVAAVMLPLGFLTGLLGINVGGIPLAESSMGFLIVCGLLAVIVVIEVLVLRRMRWL
jgi:zinc transporter